MVLLFLACSSGPELARQGTLFGQVSGVALNPDGWSGGRVGVFSSTCNVNKAGEMGSEYDFGWGEETGTDTDGLHVVVTSGDEVHVQTDETWFSPVFDSFRVEGLVDARFSDGELVAMAETRSGCELVWPESEEALEVPCGQMLEGPNGLLVDTDAGLFDPLLSELVLEPWDSVVWDAHQDRYLVSDGLSVSALTQEGSTLWSMEPGGRVTDLAPTRAGAAVSVEYDDLSGALVLVDEVALDTPTMSWAGHTLEVSDDGLNMALVRDHSLVFFELRP